MKKEMVDEIGNNIKEKKKMSKEYETTVNKRIFSNILIGVLVLAYLILIILGYQNIDSSIFVVDLKVFSVGILCLSIILFERSYKKENGKLCVYGVEMLLLAVLTLGGIYVFQIVPDIFITSVSITAVVYSIYYVIKSIGIYIKAKKEYIKSQNDINDIVKEAKPEKSKITKKQKKDKQEKVKILSRQEIPFSEDRLRPVMTKKEEIVDSESIEEVQLKESKKGKFNKKDKKDKDKKEKNKKKEKVKEKIENKDEKATEKIVEEKTVLPHSEDEKAEKEQKGTISSSKEPTMNEKLEMLERRIKENSQKMSRTIDKNKEELTSKEMNPEEQSTLKTEKIDTKIETKQEDAKVTKTSKTTKTSGASKTVKSTSTSKATKTTKKQPAKEATKTATKKTAAKTTTKKSTKE